MYTLTKSAVATTNESTVYSTRAIGITKLPIAREHEFILIDVPEDFVAKPELLDLFDHYLSADHSVSEAWEDTTGGNYD